jgi:hypothetical protein
MKPLLAFLLLALLAGCGSIQSNYPIGAPFSPGTAGDIDKTRYICIQMMHDGRQIEWEEETLPCHSLNDIDDRPSPSRYKEKP